MSTDDDGEKLRRWVSLRHLSIGPAEDAYKTGHFLVIDVEPGRNLAPWIILASQYANDSGFMDEDGSNLIHVPSIVERNDPKTDEGVLPGDKNRTPVAKIKALGVASGSGEPLICLFGPDSNFTVIRRGSERGYMLCIRSAYGPALPHIMGWYDDLDTGDQVCFAKDVEKYMRFNPRNGKISYEKRAFNSFAGEVGAFGEITDDCGFIPVSRRRDRLGKERPPSEARYKEVFSSSGF